MMRKVKHVIYKEDDQFVALCLNCGVASQGDTYEEALHNIQEAVELYYEDEDEENLPYIAIESVTLTEQNLNA